MTIDGNLFTDQQIEDILEQRSRLQREVAELKANLFDAQMFITKEYARLATLADPSDDESDRMKEILAIALPNASLSLLINEIDLQLAEILRDNEKPPRLFLSEDTMNCIYVYLRANQ